MARTKKKKTPAKKKKLATTKNKKSWWQRPKKRTRSKSKKPKTIMGFLFKWGIVFSLWAGIIGAVMLLWFAAELPQITRSATFDYKPSITIMDANNNVLLRYGETKGETLSIKDIPNNLIYAVLATEDRRFYQHFGIDLIGLARAMAVNLYHGHVVQGGSTITQQLAKNLFLSHERTLKRKVQEALLAIELERTLSKDEILAAYLNRVYLGSGTYGVEAAAKRYFNKPVQDLSLQESALLAGLLKAPSRYSPLNDPKAARERTDVVISAMIDAGFITRDDVKGLLLLPRHETIQSGQSHRYFTDWVINGLDDIIGAPGEDITIYTTLNLATQRVLGTAIRKTIDTHGKEAAMTQGAGIIMRPDGAVIAMVGGYDYGQSQFNRITQAKRQPGSAFKPFVYLTALNKGWRPGDEILDAPLTNDEGEYRPDNFANEYLGTVTLEEALASSLNTAALRLAKEVGLHDIQTTARTLGIISPLANDLSISLGSSALSPLELSTAYATIANEGHLTFPYAITKITGEDGELYYERPSYERTKKVMRRAPLRDITAMLKSVTKQGTGGAAYLEPYAAGKTGTSQNYRDAWFAGFTDGIIGVIWFGNDDNTPMNGITGGRYPAQVWRTAISAAQTELTPYQPKDKPKSFGSLLSRLLGDE